MLADIFGPDLLIVVLVVVVVLFGGAAIPKLARNLGSAQSEFKKGLSEGHKENEVAGGNTANGSGNTSSSGSGSTSQPTGEKGTTAT